MSQLSCAVFSATDELESELAQVGHLEVVARTSELGALREVVRRSQPAVLFVDLGEEPDATLDELEQLPAPRPLLVVSGPEDDSQVILRAMRLGAREFFAPEPAADLLSEAVERLLLDHGTPEPAPAEAPVVAVMGAKGGVGATFVACQLAAELERLGGQTVLTDVNLRLGDVSLYCDLQPHYTLSDLAAERVDFDSAYLRTILAPHRSGVQVLAAPKQAEDAEFIRPGHLERAVNLFRKDFDWVVLDVSRTWDEINVRALDLADQILLVTSTDVPTLNHARQHLDLLQRLGHSAEKIRLVVNRYSKLGPISSKDVGEFLGRTPDAWIPNDYRVTLTCVNEGKSLWEVAPRSGLSSAYRVLAEQTHRWCNVELTGVKPNGGIRGYILERLMRRGNGTD
jgi:pilus assembly protein CpaE